MLLREVVVEHRAVGAQRRESGVRALGPVESHEARGAGVHAEDVQGLLEHLGAVIAHVGGGGDAGRALSRGGRRRREGVEPVLGGHDVVGVHLALQRLLVGAAEPGRQGRDQRHQRQADHERRRGARRARGIARGVAACQLARLAAEAPCGRAHHGGQRAHQALGHQAHAHHQEQDAQPHEEEAAPGGAAAEHPEHHQGGAEGERHDGDHRAAAADARGRQQRALADGGHRRDVGGTQRGAEGGAEGHQRPHQDRDVDRAALEHRPRVGQREPEGVEDRVEPLGEGHPQEQPDEEASRPIAKPSSSTERMTWRREAPSVRSVANSRMRWATVIESVLKITKEPTSRAIPAKPSRMYWMILVASLVSLLSGSPVVAGLDLGRGREQRAHPGDSWFGETPGFAARKITSNWPSLSQQRLGGRDVEDARSSRRPAS